MIEHPVCGLCQRSVAPADDAITLRGSTRTIRWHRDCAVRDGLACEVCGEVGGGAMVPSTHGRFRHLTCPPGSLG